MEVEQLTQSIGAIVHGVELASDWPASGELADLLVEHQVLFFRDQQLDPTTQVAVARALGEPTPAHLLTGGLDEEHPEVLVLDSTNYLLGVGDNAGSTSYNNRWHTDVTFSATPPTATVLRAIELPPFGGDTLWSNLEATWNALPADLKVKLEHATALHSTATTFERLHESEEGEDLLRTVAEVEHPVVRVHPVSGRWSAFVNPTFTQSVVGLSTEESDQVLASIYEIAAAPERTVRWRWRAGDVAIWDNRSTSHYASADYDGRRVMHRVTVAGEVPVGP